MDFNYGFACVPPPPCFWVHRSGLDGDPQNLGSRLSGSAGLPELEAVRGPVLHSQPLFGAHLQAAHAREPKVPHGGAKGASSSFCSGNQLLFMALLFVFHLWQVGQEAEAIQVFRLMFDLNNRGKGNIFSVSSTP